MENDSFSLKLSPVDGGVWDQWSFYWRRTGRKSRKEAQHIGFLQGTCIILRSILLCPLDQDWILAFVSSVWPIVQVQKLMVQVQNRLVFSSSLYTLAFCFLARCNPSKEFCLSALGSCICPYGNLLLKNYIEIQKTDFSHTNAMLQSWKSLHFTSTSLLQGHPAASHLWQNDLFGIQLMVNSNQVSRFSHFSTHIPCWSPMQIYNMLNTELLEQTPHLWLLQLFWCNLREDFLPRLTHLPLYNHLHIITFT